jgi:hypothetical protein
MDSISLSAKVRSERYTPGMAEQTHTIESVPSLLKELEARVESIRDSL